MSQCILHQCPDRSLCDSIAACDAKLLAKDSVGTMTREKAVNFLEETAKYFENRPTGGEDRAHWANVYNAENCRKIAVMIRSEHT